MTDDDTVATITKGYTFSEETIELGVLTGRAARKVRTTAPPGPRTGKKKNLPPPPFGGEGLT